MSQGRLSAAVARGVLNDRTAEKAVVADLPSDSTIIARARQ
jgi:hypothetical protein